MRYWLSRLRLWFWTRVDHTCVRNDRVLVAGYRTICRRCGRMMWRDPRDENL